MKDQLFLHLPRSFRQSVFKDCLVIEKAQESTAGHAPFELVVTLTLENRLLFLTCYHAELSGSAAMSPIAESLPQNRDPMWDPFRGEFWCQKFNNF